MTPSISVRTTSLALCTMLVVAACSSGNGAGDSGVPNADVVTDSTPSTDATTSADGAIDAVARDDASTIDALGDEMATGADAAVDTMPSDVGIITDAADAGADADADAAVDADADAAMDSSADVNTDTGTDAAVPNYRVLTGSTRSLGVIGTPTGPTSFSAFCQPGSVGIGLNGCASDHVGAVAIVCARLMSDGTFGTPTNPTPACGSGTVAFADRCEAGSVLVSLRGSVGTNLVSIAAGCAPLDAQVVGAPTPTFLTLRGGTTGGTPYEAHCPAGYVMHRFGGRIQSGAVTSIGPECVAIAR